MSSLLLTAITALQTTNPFSGLSVKPQRRLSGLSAPGDKLEYAAINLATELCFTPKNYIDLSCQVNFDQLPALKGHDLALNAFKDAQSAYNGNKTVKAVMDHYLWSLTRPLQPRSLLRLQRRERYVVLH